jgi:lambda family phage tail tape measure protein
MATNDTVVLYFKLSDLGETIEGNHKKLKGFRSTFDSLQKDMDKAGSKGGGWKNAAMGGSEYDRARGTTGQSGASGRDFANQARGLDGLVRLYATYAANLFAVSAAFRALSDAMDTTNMVQGMNQLGASSGQALGTIAKNLMLATDGAISMREAMEATTKGTAAGLTGKQMEQLGQVANKASKALGIAMPDAISRLTRGISKLEPELLDELGLFTKIGPATESYARSIGKSASNLTDFEKRQAFANAVLKEGIDKFNSIDIVANPYDKLLASLKNVAQTILEVINKAITPLVNLLSQSPTALLAAIALIGSTIVKKALPAIGNYREELRNAAQGEQNLTKVKLDAAKKAQALRAAELIAIKDAAATERTARVDALEARLKEISGGRLRKDIKQVLSPEKGILDISKEDLAKLDAAGKQLKDRNNIYVQLATAIRQAQKEENNYINTAARLEKERLNPGKFSQVGILTAQAAAQQRREKSSSIVSNAADTASLVGFGAALSQIRKEINPKELGYFRAGMTGIAAATTAATVRVSGIISTFGTFGAIAGIVIGFLEMIYSWFTKVDKQSAELSKALTTLNDATDNTNRTLSALAKQPGIATASIQGFLALSNASRGATDSIELTIDAANNLLKALDASRLDSIVDGFKKIFNQDAAYSSAEALAKVAEQQLKLFNAAGLGTKASEDFKDAIGVESLDVATLTKAFLNNVGAQNAFAKANKALDARLGESSANLQNFKTATEALTKAYDEFIQSTASSNPMFKIGAALEDVATSMQKLATGSIQEVNAAFNDLVDNPRKIAQFGQSFVDQFVMMRQQFKTTLQDYEAYGQSIRAIDDQIAQSKQKLKDIDDRPDFEFNRPSTWLASMGDPLGSGAKKEDQEKIIKYQEEARANAAKAQAKIDIEVFKQGKLLFAQGVEAAFTKGAELIDKALGQASQKAAISIAQAGLGALSGGVAARASGRIKGDELNLQMQQIDSTIELIASNTALTAAISESTARMAEARAANDPKASRAEKSETGAQLTAAKIFKNASSQVSLGKIDAKDLNKFLTSNEQVDTYLKPLILGLQRQIAQQTANKIDVGGKQAANVIETDRAARLGDLEDLNKERSIRNDINQQKIAGLDILASIDTLNGAQRVQEKTELENQIIKLNQLKEIDQYNVAIINAQKLGTKDGDKQASNLQTQLNLVRDRQKVENNTKPVADRAKFRAAEFEAATKLSALNEAILDQDIARLGIINSLVGFSSEQNILATTSLENKKLENKFALELKKITDELRALEEDKSRDNTKSIALKQTELALVTARQEKEKDNKGLQDALKLVEARFDLEQKLAGFRKTAADAQSQQAEDELNYRKELGLVTSFDAVKEKANIDRGRVARETAQEQASIDKDIAKKSLLEKKILEIEASGDSALAGDYEAVNNMTNSINAQSAALQATNQQKMNAIDLNEKLGSKMTGFSKIVENSFQSMADALADFAKTGKLDFKALVDQMILDLIRFEMRAQMSSLFTAAGGLGGLMKLVGLGGGGVSPETMAISANAFNINAKGGVYDTGLQTFAKGGMFTNSVVNQPTLFKFAQGTGLMGEAGPEAIMPLKRDSNGNLGVRSGQQGSNVDVVVNNYGNEKATTKETTDSRGNRRIEVIVGDMVASELSRPGSSVQQSLSNNYGNRPSVARR